MVPALSTKTKKNFCNLMHHEADFGLKASWNFYATSHGKNTCDGIGGTVKRLAARHSLQNRTISSPKELFEFAETIQKVRSIWVSSSEVLGHASMLDSRFLNMPKVGGCREGHRFSRNGDNLNVFRVSSDTAPFTVVSYDEIRQPAVQTEDISVGHYVAVKFDIDWYVGIVLDYDDEHDDYRVNCLHPKGTASSHNFHWPRPREDICWIPTDHVICKVKSLGTIQGRQFRIDDDERMRIVSKFTAMR